MKRIFAVFLVSVLMIFSLSGCAEEIPQPTAAGDFGLTMEQFEAYMEGSRIKIGVIYGFIPDPEGGKLEFREKEMDGIQKYTAKSDGAKVEAFCKDGNVYCVRVSGDVTKKTFHDVNPDVKCYGIYAEYTLMRERNTPAIQQTDPMPFGEEARMFDFSDGETKDLKGSGIVFHGERKGDKVTMVFTPSENRNELEDQEFKFAE